MSSGADTLETDEQNHRAEDAAKLSRFRQLGFLVCHATKFET